MYLVLMALLALNVTKEVLNSFVAIEEDLQKSTLTQLDRGNSSKLELIEAKNDQNLEKVKKVKYYLNIIDKIDKLTSDRIKEIDEIKIDILKKSGEKIDVEKLNDTETIIWKKYNEKSPLTPTRLNLMAVQAKDQFDVPMHEIIGEDLTNITGSGKQLWENYNQYRNSICDLVGTYYTSTNKNFKLKTIHINKYQDNKDLENQIEKMLSKNPYNKNDDKEVLKQIYMELTKNERFDTEETKNIHWIGKTFDHSPLVASIASLTALEQEILAARATAVSHIKSRVSTGEFSFNKVMPLAYGPTFANAGEDIELSVMMAAYDSDNQPDVKLSKGSGSISISEGKGTIKVKVNGSNEMTLNGKISIKKKSGELKEENWSHTIKIMKPQGSISLPEMNILYRNYPNQLVGIVSGYDETILQETDNIKLSKTNSGYIGKPGNGRSCSIAVLGRNSVTKKTVKLGEFKYRVANMPKPALYLGTLESGIPVSITTIKSMNLLFAKYPPDAILKSNFNVLSWELKVDNYPSIQDKGNKLNQKAINLLKMVKSNSQVTIYGKYKGSGYEGNIPPFSVKIL